MGKEMGPSPLKRGKGGRTVSPSHRVIDLSKNPEGKPKSTNLDERVRSLLAQLRDDERRHAEPPRKRY